MRSLRGKASASSSRGRLANNAPIDDVELVKMLERTEQFSGVKPAPQLAESSFALEVVEQLAAVDEGEDEVELLRVLERELERDDERVVDRARTVRSARVWVTSERETMCAFRIVLSA